MQEQQGLHGVSEGLGRPTMDEFVLSLVLLVPAGLQH